jgi:hypothetical protein
LKYRKSATRPAPGDAGHWQSISVGRIYGVVIASPGRTDFHQHTAEAHASGPSLRCRDVQLLG